MEPNTLKTDNSYIGLRVIYNRKSGNYELVNVQYDQEGVPADVTPTNVLGGTLAETREALQALIHDIDHWVDEELTLLLKH